MLIGKDDLGEIFDQIHNTWIQYRTAVIILCAADCDAICTTKILTSLLGAEMISYQIYPVLSYEHVAHYTDSLQSKIVDGELHSIMMVNCGGIVDLHQMLFVRPLVDKFHSEQQQLKQNKRGRRMRSGNDLDDDDDLDDDEFEEDDDDEDEQVNEEQVARLNEYVTQHMQQIDARLKIYVFDAHRPFNLSNVYDQHKIYLLQGDDEQKMNEFPEIIDADDEEEAAQLSPAQNDENDDVFDDDDDDDDDDDENMHEPMRKKRRLNTASLQPQSGSRVSERGRHIIRIQREQSEYYKLQYYALHSSGIAYLMARSVHKDDNEMLWSAILGLTESFVHEKIDRDRYNQCVTLYCDEVKRRNASSEQEVSYDSRPENIENSSIVTHRNMDHIQFGMEFSFVLLRFWTLYDAMYYSRYIATKLAVWKQSGRENLKYLLAKMALPLNEAQQPYCSMKRAYKQKLAQLFQDNLDQGLDDNLMYGSFTKQHGGHAALSAADMVYAITAVLESDFRVKSNDHFQVMHEMNTNAQQQQQQQPQSTGQQTQVAAAASSAEQQPFFDDNAWQSNFFYGYDVLAKDKPYLLRDAIELAKKRQHEIIDMGIRLIEKRDIHTMTVMRWCKIENYNIFQSPMLLCKLAIFVMDAFRIQTTKAPKHFVLASFNDKSNSYTVVGLPAKREYGDVQKSPFYNAFEEARKRVNATAKIVFFEGHVIQIHKNHFMEWLDNLHERLLSFAF
uniref:Cell division control protein 45 n=1 Tax=Elphidium margaritaceum TaxID=933848 RepID=A0A7S0TED4_9EUKA|mmetsp:Transcript_1765/g.3466  ORF Transcript_1765/g.3466 Transcript_1765/m.3466 type:complete len:729 (+) Transcript_1765:36-2222(+)